MSFGQAAAAAVALLLSACASAHRVETEPVPHFSRNQPVAVWRAGQADTLTSVVIADDSLRGRRQGVVVALPMTQVDSLTTRSGGEAIWFALPIGAAAAALIIWQATEGD